MAGLRAGFVLADPDILNNLRDSLGPWTLSNPSRFVTTYALKDLDWQENTRIQLQQQSNRLNALLTQYQLIPNGSTLLFQWVKTENAELIHQQLAERAIFTRLFEKPASLRFGLPANESGWQLLQSALKDITTDN